MSGTLPDPLPLDYQPAQQSRRRGWWGRLVLQLLTAYFLASIVTIPFIDSWWIDEIPPLAVIQLPKTMLAGWLRTDVVMPVIRIMGLSRGSFSPDYGLARPYGMVLAYAIVLGVVLLVLRVSGQMKRTSRRWMWITLAGGIL